MEYSRFWFSQNSELSIRSARHRKKAHYTIVECFGSSIFHYLVLQFCKFYIVFRAAARSRSIRSKKVRIMSVFRPFFLNMCRFYSSLRSLQDELLAQTETSSCMVLVSTAGCLPTSATFVAFKKEVLNNSVSRHAKVNGRFTPLSAEPALRIWMAYWHANLCVLYCFI